MDHTMKLPDEVMVAVLKNVPLLELPRCAMVCRRWRRLASDESLWSRVYLKVEKMPFRKLAKIIEHGVRELEVFGQIVGSPEGAFKPDFKSPLRVLVMYATHIMAKSMHRILERTSELKELRVGLAPMLNRSCFLSIGQNPNLEILDLGHAENLDPSWITHVLRHCQNLKELNMESTRLGTRALEALISKLPGSLTDLNLNDVSTHLQDTHVAEIVKRCPNLEFLDIGNNRNITPEAEKIASKLEHLKHLDTEKDSDEEWEDEEDDSDALFHFLGDSDDDLDESDALEQWMQYKDAKERDDGSDIFYLMNLDRIYNPGMYDDFMGGSDDSDDSD